MNGEHVDSIFLKFQKKNRGFPVKAEIGNLL